MVLHQNVTSVTDNVFGVTQMPEDDLTNWMDFVSNYHPSIEFTRTTSANTINFLDIIINLLDNKLNTTVHYKPTDSHNYLLYDSFHPKNCKNAIPYSQFLRLHKLTTHNVGFETSVKAMSSFFEHQG